MVLNGAARKIALVIVIFSVIGWITYIVGFALRIHFLREEDDNNDENINSKLKFHIRNAIHEDFTPYWCFAIVAPFLFIIYFIHLYFNVIFTHYMSIFFTAIYLVAAGGVLYMDGMFIAQLVRDNANGDDSSASVISKYYWIIIESVGAFVSIIFYWFSMMLWPCFKKNKVKGYYDY
jgi:hypothetical protein